MIFRNPNVYQFIPNTSKVDLMIFIFAKAMLFEPKNESVIYRLNVGFPQL